MIKPQDTKKDGNMQDEGKQETRGEETRLVRAEDEKGKQELEESHVSYPKSEGTMEGWKVARARRSTCQGFYRYLHSHYIHMISK